MKESFSSQVKSIASTFGTNTIFVVGKGASVDEVNLAVLANNLVIGLNDSERITPCDITIFRDAWVHAAIEDNNCRSQLYICSTEFKASRGDVVKEQDVSSAHGGGTDMMMSRLLSESPGEMFAIESVLFISALRLARLIADQRQQKQTVYMIGFDFSVDKGYSKAVAKDYAPNQEGEHDASISPQEFCFINALYMLRDSCLEVRHVGDRAFSSLTTEELNSLFLPELAEGTKHEQNRVLVIADLTTNHFGDRNRLERMVRSARAAGADLIKVHKRNVESFYSQEQLESKYMSPFGHTFRDYRHALELSTEDFEFLDKLCNDLGIQWFASVLDEPSFRFMQQFELDLGNLWTTSAHGGRLASICP
jgi:N-acetylneuraminate synthase